MKKSALVQILALLGSSLALPAFAADAPASAVAGVKIAVVDMQKAIQTVDAGKKAKSQLEKEYATKKKMIDDEEKALQKLFEELKKQSLVMNDEAKMKKQQELQERGMKLQQTRFQAQTELQQKEADLTSPIVKKMKEEIKSLAAKKGYTLVLDKNETNVLFSQDADDLTGDLVSTFNSKNK